MMTTARQDAHVIAIVVSGASGTSVVPLSLASSSVWGRVGAGWRVMMMMTQRDDDE
jgi:hypothetical protein